MQAIAATPLVPLGRSPVVVIVDNDPAVCSSLKFSLELEGFMVRAYGNAAEFLNADDWACDCLVVDQRMPGMSGMELIAKLRTLEVRTPAILLISQPNLAWPRAPPKLRFRSWRSRYLATRCSIGFARPARGADKLGGRSQSTSHTRHSKSGARVC